MKRALVFLPILLLAASIRLTKTKAFHSRRQKLRLLFHFRNLIWFLYFYPSNEFKINFSFIDSCVIVFIKRVFEVRDFRINLLILFFSSFVFANFASYSDNLLIYFLIFGSIWFSLSYFLKTRLLW